MNNSYNVIRALIRTEKATMQEPKGKYLFLVDTCANKIQIKEAVQKLYRVKVAGVNTFISCGKLKRVRYQLGRTAQTKKAIVTLREGYKIGEAAV